MPIAHTVFDNLLSAPHIVNPLNAELNPIRYLLALVGARHIVHVSRIRVKQDIIYPNLDFLAERRDKAARKKTVQNSTASPLLGVLFSSLSYEA